MFHAHTPITCVAFDAFVRIHARAITSCVDGDRAHRTNRDAIPAGYTFLRINPHDVQDSTALSRKKYFGELLLRSSRVSVIHKFSTFVSQPPFSAIARPAAIPAHRVVSIR